MIRYEKRPTRRVTPVISELTVKVYVTRRIHCTPEQNPSSFSKPNLSRRAQTNDLEMVCAIRVFAVERSASKTELAT